MGPEEALQRVTLHALEDDGFRQRWDEAVRDAADALAAEVAGARMAGSTQGRVAWVREVPQPGGMEYADVQAAFAMAVQGEVGRRLAVMTSPEGFG